MNPLDAAADLASIVTAAVAVVAAGWYWCGRKRRQRRLEDYLRSRLQAKPKGLSVAGLMADLRMTEAQVFEAGFSSSKIEAAHSSPREDTPLQHAILFLSKEG
jgi:hypothetical protein